MYKTYMAVEYFRGDVSTRLRSGIFKMSYFSFGLYTCYTKLTSIEIKKINAFNQSIYFFLLTEICKVFDVLGIHHDQNVTQQCVFCDCDVQM